MMMPDKKKMLTTVISKLKSNGSSEESKAPTKDDVEQDSSIGNTSAMDEFISAVHSKDSKKAVESLKSFISMHEAEEDNDQPTNKDEEGPVQDESSDSEPVQGIKPIVYNVDKKY